MTGELASDVAGLATLGLRFYAAILLTGAAIGKLRDRGHAARAISAYRVLPPALERPAAAALPLVELAAALALALVPHTVSTMIAAALFAVFAAAVGINLARGRRSLDCGCGFGRRKIGPALAAHNLVLALLLLAGAAQATPATALSILFALMWAGAMLALLLSLDTLNSIETPAKRQKAR